MNFYCALARNSMPWLPNNLHTILSLKNQEDKIIIVENNSTDATKTVLKHFQDGCEDGEVILLGEDDDMQHWPQKPLKERADYLGKLRNIYLDYIADNFNDVTDNVIVFDSDLQEIPTKDFDKLFTEHAATCANGLIHYQISGSGSHTIYYDTWAFLSLDNDFIHGVKNPVPFMKPPGLVEVRSAFGGVGVYKWEAIKDCRYSFFDLNKLHQNGKPMTLGEHGGFNKEIREKGGRVFVQSEYFCFNKKVIV